MQRPKLSIMEEHSLMDTAISETFKDTYPPDLCLALEKYLGSGYTKSGVKLQIEDLGTETGTVYLLKASDRLFSIELKISLILEVRFGTTFTNLLDWISDNEYELFIAQIKFGLRYIKTFDKLDIIVQIYYNNFKKRLKWIDTLSIPDETECLVAIKQEKDATAPFHLNKEEIDLVKISLQGKTTAELLIIRQQINDIYTPVIEEVELETKIDLKSKEDEMIKLVEPVYQHESYKDDGLLMESESVIIQEPTISDILTPSDYEPINEMTSEHKIIKRKKRNTTRTFDQRKRDYV
jgi:hypothetical protein